MSSRGLPSFRLCFLRSALRRFFEERLEQMKHPISTDSKANDGSLGVGELRGKLG